jgi:hypothetical protein
VWKKAVSNSGSTAFIDQLFDDVFALAPGASNAAAGLFPDCALPTARSSLALQPIFPLLEGRSARSMAIKQNTTSIGSHVRYIRYDC